MMEVWRTQKNKHTCTENASEGHVEERSERESDLVVELECTQAILRKPLAHLIAHPQVVLRACYPTGCCLCVRRC